MKLPTSIVRRFRCQITSGEMVKSGENDEWVFYTHKENDSFVIGINKKNPDDVRIKSKESVKPGMRKR